MTMIVRAVDAGGFEAELARLAGSGQAQFEATCGKCHNLRGPELVGPTLGGNPTLADREALETLLREGRGEMPAIGRDWTDAQLDTLFAYTTRCGRRAVVAVRAEPIYPVPWYRGRFVSWLVTTDHKRIGVLYIWTSLAFFLLGGVMALLIRTELLTPETADFVSRQTFNQLFTMHGLTMVFLVIVPILAGFGNYLVPLMIGARDMVFPRLNAFSYWTFLLGGIVLYSSWFSAGGAADTGWYLYPPYAIRTGTSVDLTILALHLLAVSSLAGAINFVATVHTMRTAGMTWMRMPLFVWTIYTYAWLLIIALPAVAAALTMLLLDRTAGTHFFLPDEGGSAVLYQHMFWFFGHPEVYIMVLPAFGIVSEVIPVFARKPIFGYAAIAFSTVGIAFVSMLVWAHHMFAVGLPNFLNGFFMIASVLVGVPTGIKIINWLATLWRGNITSRRRCCSRSVSSRCSRSAASPGSWSPRSRSTGRCTTRTSSSRTCTTCSSAGRSSASLPGSTTGGRRCSGACSARASASSTSGSTSSGST